MGELRKDYFSQRWVVIAAEREKRPRDFKKHAAGPALKARDGKCPFCPGNESMTPPEIMRVGQDGGSGNGGKAGWAIRVFPNKFPAFKDMGGWKQGANGLNTAGPAHGAHEVVVETPKHNEQMADLSAGRIAKVFEVCAERQAALLATRGIKHVSVFKNKGATAGTSLIHSHMQIAAHPLESRIAAMEARAERLHRKKAGKCGYCGLVGVEMKSERAVAENRHFAVFAPWASRFGYEAMFLPKRHICALTELREAEFLGLAELVKGVLEKLALLNADYNIYFHGSPKGEDLHFHVHLTPRLAKWAGFEFESGIVINSFPPESAAAFYRGETG